MKKEINIKKILIGAIFMLVILVIAIGVTNHNNYLKYVQCKASENKVKMELAQNKSKVKELNKEKSKEEKKSNVEAISKNVKGFVNAYFNYSGSNRNKIYDNIKPYATEYLINKLKPTSTVNNANTDNTATNNVSANNQSNVNYSVYIKNIKIYDMLQSDEYNTNVLVLADEGLQTSTSNSTSSVLLELKLRNVNSKWLVDDILQNRSLQSIQK